MMPITPNHLLLGRATIEVPDMDYDPTSKFSARLAYVEQVYKAWWSKWIQDVLPTLVPCKRWKYIQRNVKVGDVVMMKYASSIKDEYRLARVLEVYPDDKGLVRTVKIGYRRKDKREGPNVYWKKPLVEEKVAVQRLAMLQAVNEPPVASSEEYAGIVASSKEYAGVEVSQGPDCVQVGAGADSEPATKVFEGVAAGSPATNERPASLDQSPKEVFEGVAAGSPAALTSLFVGFSSTTDSKAISFLALS